ncbi:hypothetical protein L0222_13200 [bacterium]|nr:hypothetical protein [bacterium]MCI0601645.1 hypothetical protein [bacterium]
MRRVSYGRFSLKIVDLEDLIHIKEESGRPQDLADAEALREIRRMKKK